MTIEVEYTTYLSGSTFRPFERSDNNGYTVIPDKYINDLLHLKKSEKRVKEYDNLGSFISSFENEVKKDYSNEYLLNDLEICIDSIKIKINLND